MKRKNRLETLVLVFLFILVTIPVAYSQETTVPDNEVDSEEVEPVASGSLLTLEGIEGHTGMIWIRNEVYDEAPGDRGNDTLAGLLGLTAMIRINGNLNFSPAILFYMENYALAGSDGLSMPSDVASAGHLTTLGMFVRIPFLFSFNLKPFTIEADVGPAFWLRFPLWGPGESDRNDMFASFYKDGRFIYLTGAGRIVYRIGETWQLTGGVELFFPVANLWIQDDLPFSEGIGVSLHIGIRKELPSLSP
jgi:hypothetical protein